MSLAKELEKKLPAQLDPKAWVSAARVGQQDRLITFLLWIYGFLIVATVILIFFQGFHVKGFLLPNDFLKWLGGATIGEIGGLLVIAFRATFK